MSNNKTVSEDRTSKLAQRYYGYDRYDPPPNVNGAAHAPQARRKCIVGNVVLTDKNTITKPGSGVLS